ncbi:SpoIID/LytB domain-containing protein [Vulgatibacter sp.]|uniref:SpoIID/LytB domain-containing protein n=1 Tax=Vulgatibacter sp. TaxID=1971226 RepID=UPI00356B1ED3
MRSLLLAATLLLLPAAASAAEVEPRDPMETLWAHRLQFAPDGSPLVTVRIDEGEDEIRLTAKGAGAIEVGSKRIPVAPGTTLRFRARQTREAEVAWSAQVAELPFHDKDAARAALAKWAARGYPVRAATIGGVFGLHGRVLDNRRYVILIGRKGTRAEAQALADAAAAKFDDAQPTLHSALARRPSGSIEILDAAGKRIITAKNAAAVDAQGGIVVHAVEHDIGYAAHGREDRTYRGRLLVTVDAAGGVAVVNALPLEELIRGIVPSEIFATAPLEALKAQAVTARGEILAKIGARHTGDPFLLCAEQHCQVYKGLSGEHPRTDQAIAASRGEALFAQDGTLVDSVYSSTCGGHTENNEAVWGTPPNPSLRGVPDWLGHPAPLVPFEAKVEDVHTFLASDVPSMCRESSFSRADKYRWERRFTAAEMDAVGSRLGVGAIRHLEVTGRGVSGRALGLAFTGTGGATVVSGELKIRRLLGNLNSALFVVEREGPAERPTGWRFRGAGWGHGVGMCQTGAIGRAERGHDHRAILRHYYNGAEPTKLY